METDPIQPEVLPITPKHEEQTAKVEPSAEATITHQNGDPNAKTEDVVMHPVDSGQPQEQPSQDPPLVKPEDPSPAPPKLSPTLRSQKLPLPKGIRDMKADAKDVVVISFGSFGVRYGFAVDSTPKRVFPAVAFPRSAKALADSSSVRFCTPSHSVRSAKDVIAAKERFEEIRDEVAQELTLQERRRGGGRPTPWKVLIEPVPSETFTGAAQFSGPIDNSKTVSELTPNEVLVGPDVEVLVRDPQRAELYDVIFPIWDGKVLFHCGAPESFVRKALDCLIDYVVEQLKIDKKKKIAASRDAATNGNANGVPAKRPEETTPFAEGEEAKTFVALVVPETSQRRDAAEIVDAIFRSRSMQTAAIFIHQSAVSCAFGAGLATCAVVDIGHSATTVACVEDGLICGESRIHLNYGSCHIQSTLELLLKDSSQLTEIITSQPGVDGKPLTPQQIAQDQEVVIARIAEQTGSFNVDANDTLGVALLKLPSGRGLRLKLGVGFRALPCYGLIHPTLLSAASAVVREKMNIPRRGVFEMNADVDNFATTILNDMRRSGIATAALPIGTFANDPDQPASTTVDSDRASIVDAIVWSVAKAVELKRPDQQSRTAEHYRRYLNAIVLAGGGASIDGIALALEARIKKGFLDTGLIVADVTVIDGGKGKGDEELAAAAATLKEAGADGGIIDDTDTASLPWKGGAVMVESEAVREYWVYRDDWEDRSVFALRERAPFYW